MMDSVFKITQAWDSGWLIRVRAPNQVINKNRGGQPLSNRGWQDGGMDTENGVLELWSGTAATDETQIKHGYGLPYKETKKRGNKERKMGGGGKKWFGIRAYVGKGGSEVGKRAGLSRLGPDNSTQVVDFPYMYEVEVVSGRGLTAETPRRRDEEKGGVRTEPVVKVEKGVSGCRWRRV